MASTAASREAWSARARCTPWPRAGTATGSTRAGGRGRARQSQAILDEVGLTGDFWRLP